MPWHWLKLGLMSLTGAVAIMASIILWQNTAKTTVDNYLSSINTATVLFSLSQEIMKNNNDNITNMPPPYFKNGIMKPVIGAYQADFDGSGLIFSVKKQTPVFSPQAGKIIFSSIVPDIGTVVMIQHTDKQVSVLKGIIINNHLKKGTMLQAGEYIGHTGNKTTFFYMLRKNTKVVDPRKMFVTVSVVP